MITRHLQAGELTLRLGRPDRANALSADLVEALLSQVHRGFADESVQRLVLRAEGAHFCSGLDLSDLDAASDGDLLHRLVRIETLLATLWHAPVQTVAVAQGRVWGAGADLFAACEVRVATAGTSFRFPGAQFGIVLGTRRLADRVGRERAIRWVTQGCRIEAAEALASGLATDIEEPAWTPPVVSPAVAKALRGVARSDLRDLDLAARVRSASEPGLKQRVLDYARGLKQGRDPEPRHPVLPMPQEAP